ncbi:triphosphoribosyl-dephospho-CoA synthase CitG [Paraclostridium dentum]|uniref:triphosphoribosyl-dephospho-CoA synthase CitG n=1 Tax=Paraclostridium dentum TaxID=2662455 RepID=UPI001475247A|nr:triphosphoribosyl-dephospho-CoA synthase CitG [Paraclostridium dentum]
MKLSEIDRFLLDREKRVQLQEQLLQEHNICTLVTVRVNYPGLEKSNFITDEIQGVISDEISEICGELIVLKKKYKNLEGYITHFLIDLDFFSTKRLMIDIEENHILGRCVDIDVYKINGEKVFAISRRDLGKGNRRCFLCELDANICSRKQSHSINEIKSYFEKKYNEYIKYLKKRDFISSKLSNLALKSIISEVSTYPSFGLVSPISSGSHNDMDYYTFLDSGFAIVPYLKKMAEHGYSYNSEENIFKQIRKIGQKAEEEMFKATKEINTHKGMIFLMGIVIASVSKNIYDEKLFENIQKIIKNMVKNILDDFKNLDKKNQLSHGEKLYQKYGFTGIRGQVSDGLDFIFNKILIEYKTLNLKGNDLYSHTLLILMSEVEDSTILYRHDIETLKKVHKDCKNLLQSGGMSTDEGKKLAFKLEAEYIDKRISPGGSADLLAIVIFLGEVYDIFYKI